MTPAVLDRPGSLFADAAGRPGGGGHPVAGGRVTLEELLNATLRVARTNGSADCPVCRARMTYTRAGAECAGCGSRLS
jgi:hypothetical protein